MKKICIICHTNIKNDPRVYRQVSYFAKKYAVTVIGNGELPNIPNITMYQWNLFYHRAANIFEKAFFCLALIFRCFSVFEKRFSLKNFPELQKTNFDYIIVNEINSLFLGFLIAKKSPVHCDLHEYYLDKPDSIHGKISYSLTTWLCKTYLKKCKTLSTVSTGLVENYEKITNIKPALVINAPHSQDLPIIPCNKKKIQLIYHGYAEKNRNLENLISIIAELDTRFDLTLMLTNNSPHKKYIMDIAAPYHNIYFVDPVPMVDICKTINTYDIEIIQFGKSRLYNRKYCLPNKFFEAIQAHLALAVGPSPEMAPIVKKYDIGIVSDDFSVDTMVKKLNALTYKDIMRFKRNTLSLIKMYNAETAMATLEKMLFPEIK